MNGEKVAILVAEGFEQVEMTEPKRALEEAVRRRISPLPTREPCKAGNIWRKGTSSLSMCPLKQANPEDFDALLLPGGVANPISRTKPQAVQLVKAFVDSGKPVAVICHGP